MLFRSTGLQVEGSVEVEELPDLNFGYNPDEHVAYHQDDDMDGLYTDPSMDVELLSSSGPIEISSSSPAAAPSSPGPVVIDSYSSLPNDQSSRARAAKRRRLDVESIIDIPDSTPVKYESPSLLLEPSSPEVQIISPRLVASSSKHRSPSPPSKAMVGGPEPLSAYMCPICFSPPTNATLTPCGHVCCGECLFTAVRAALQRTTVMPRPDFTAR